MPRASIRKFLLVASLAASALACGTARKVDDADASSIDSNDAGVPTDGGNDSDAGPGDASVGATDGGGTDSGTIPMGCDDPIRALPNGHHSCTVPEVTGLRPYLQSPTESSIRVSWKTASGTESAVDYGLAPNALDATATGETQQLRSDYQYHRVALDGLLANTRYFYRARTGTTMSDVHSFRTPEQAGTTTGHLRLLVMGDHQIINEPRHTRMVRAAYEKVQELYGCDPSDAITAVLNVGDQVDVGTLEHYEHLHFGQSALITPSIPTMTLIGNHETYSDPGLANYRAHFVYDHISYAGLFAPDRELYYAFQLKSVLVVMLDSEHPSDAQRDWAASVVDAAATDPNVQFVIALSHRPIQAEQYVGDVSPWVRAQVIPVLLRTPKFVMYIGAHHHLYARGQLRNDPAYHLISGGTAWDQYWGMSTEQDFSDVQKTIDFWGYQIVDFDLAREEMTVETYAMGSPRLGYTIDNELIDRFHRNFGGVEPNRPTITNPPAAPVELPYTFRSSMYSTNACELPNSTEWQIGTSMDFATLEVSLYRDYEDLYGTTGNPTYRPVDVNAGVDLFSLPLVSMQLVSGTHYVRVRHRDRNLEWSEYSAPVPFEVIHGGSGVPSLSLADRTVAPGESVVATYAFGPGNAKDWLGVYHEGVSPGSQASVKWSYVTGTAGMQAFSLDQPGQYYVGFFENDGYNELAPRVPFYYGPVPVLSSSTLSYAEGATVAIDYASAPGLGNDWIGIYRAGSATGSGSPSVQWSYVSGASGTRSFSGLARGFYFATYMLENGYVEPGARLAFAVGSEIATATTDHPSYAVNAPIDVSFANGPGTPKDYIGIFPAGAVPGETMLVAYLYVQGNATGHVTFTNGLPAGSYFAALYINDSYTEASNRVSFTVGP